MRRAIESLDTKTFEAQCAALVSSQPREACEPCEPSSELQVCSAESFKGLFEN